jgi:hypothetical protein
MSISCSCGDYEGQPGDIGFYHPEDYSEYRAQWGKKCCSCGTMIRKGATATEWTRFKIPDDEVEIRIYGEDGEVPMGSWWMCEECSDLYFNLEEAGYCVTPYGDLREEVKELHIEDPQHDEFLAASKRNKI